MAQTKTVVHSFTMGDVEDPYLYAAFPISKWQETEQGKWAKEHMVGEGEFVCIPDPMSYGFRVIITGVFEEKDLTYYKLKWQ